MKKKEKTKGKEFEELVKFVLTHNVNYKKKKIKKK